jgi:quinol monooxygenase YgiN
MKTTIERGAPVVTLINVFTVDPTKQEALVRVLDEATDRVIKDMPGFVSANIHRSLDGHHVVNYAQWESREAMDAMLAHPASQQHLRDAAALARFEPYLYEVTSVFHR